MSNKKIPVEKLVVFPAELWSKNWLLLTCGDFAANSFNAMTVGWGGFGIMWGKPIAQVVVRPVRHTFMFMERYDTFTLCAFPEKCRAALQLLGSKSGRDGNKIAESGLTPQASSKVAAPSYKEAELVVECSKIYWDDLKPEHFLDAEIEKNYPLKDYHRSYFGEILAVYGSPAFQR